MINLQVGDRVYYKGTDSVTNRPEFIITEIYDNNTMGKIRHDSGRVHTGCMLINMEKYPQDEDTYLFEKLARAESEIQIAEKLGYYDASKTIREKS